jgi:hypothetical protein
MGRELQFSFADSKWSGGIVKLDRQKLYGHVEEIVLDGSGEPCLLASILEDGRTLILSGQTALKTVDHQLAEVDKQSLKTVNLDGSEATLRPSSFDMDTQPVVVTLDELYNLEVTSVYQMVFGSEAEKQSAIATLSEIPGLGFTFNYRADYEGADAIMLTSNEEVFILTGKYVAFEYLENQQMALNLETEEEEDEDIDFGML